LFFGPRRVGTIFAFAFGLEAFTKRLVEHVELIAVVEAESELVKVERQHRTPTIGNPRQRVGRVAREADCDEEISVQKERTEPHAALEYDTGDSAH
jgi:hypothetical protein